MVGGRQERQERVSCWQEGGREGGGVKQGGTDPPVFCLTGKQESLQGRRQQKQLTGDLLPETPVRWRADGTYVSQVVPR